MSKDALEGLETASRAELIAEWTQLFGKPPSAKTGRGMMLRLLSYERQARAEGGLSPALRRRLDMLAAGKPARGVGAGAQLVRDWNGETHVVDVVEGGYRWRGEVYKSLSAIAQAITGAKWSGPRFFGLRS